MSNETTTKAFDLPKELEAIMDELVSESQSDLLGAEQVSELIAASNATGWGLDAYEIVDMEHKPDGFHFELHFTLSGNQNQDQTSMGTTITGTTNAHLDKDGRLRFRNVKAEFEEDEEGPEEGEE